MSAEKYEQHEALSEEQIKDRLYKAIQETYQHVMFGSGGKYLGYSAGIGFKVEGIDFPEPSLQRLLSELNQKKDVVSVGEYVELLKNSIHALRSFDYTKEVRPDFQQEFIDLGCLEIINHVADELEKAVG